MFAQRTLMAAMAVLSIGLAVPATAQAFPDGDIQFVVPFSPGGGTDLASRVLTERIAAQKGWNFVIENRPGAGGNIGIAQVARANAKGQVLGMGQTSNLAINPTLYDDIPYDALKDFTPIALVSSQPMVIAVAAGAPYESFGDLVEAARANPATITMSTPGAGTVSHLAMEQFSQMADVEFVHIPYPGATQAITDAIGGHIDFAASSLPSALSHIRSGSLRALAVTSAERNFALPDVPTIAEAGYAGFDAGDWKAVVGPAGLPQAVVASVNEAVNDALTDARLQDAFAAEGSTTGGGTPEDLAALMEAEFNRWAQIVSASGATTE